MSGAALASSPVDDAPVPAVGRRLFSIAGFDLFVQLDHDEDGVPCLLVNRSTSGALGNSWDEHAAEVRIHYPVNDEGDEEELKRRLHRELAALTDARAVEILRTWRKLEDAATARKGKRHG